MAKEAKAKKVHTLLVVRYEPTVKDGKELLAKDNTSQAAAMYRALVAAKGPLTVKETYAACEGKLESQAAYERLGKNLNSTLFALRKAGFVKKSEKREEAEARTRKAKANGAAPPKPKASKRPKALAAGSSSTSKKASKPRTASSKPNGHAAVEAPSHDPAKEDVAVTNEATPF